MNRNEILTKNCRYRKRRARIKKFPTVGNVDKKIFFWNSNKKKWEIFWRKWQARIEIWLNFETTKRRFVKVSNGNFDIEWKMRLLKEAKYLRNFFFFGQFFFPQPIEFGIIKIPLPDFRSVQLKEWNYRHSAVFCSEAYSAADNFATAPRK